MIVAIGSALAFMALVMGAGWIVQARARNGGWSDVFWTFGTGIAAAGCALAPLDDFPAPVERRVMIAVLAAVWSLRLGFYIAVRVARGAEDARYAELRRTGGDHFQRDMFALMIVQAPVTAILCVAVLLAAHAPGAWLGAHDVAAVLILAVAIGGEAVADAQMARFKARSASHGEICDRGLWGVSRHPNYLFEWLGWFAYPAAAASFGLDGPWFWLTLTGPALMYLLLTRVSGVPPLERAMLASRGEAFRRYQARVPVFLPIRIPGAPK
jgi:steroid 5-alpha reductase family enzyme